MNPADPVWVQLAHDRWASRNVFAACAGVGEAVLHRRFEMGLGSLHDTAVHIVGALRLWTDVLAMRPGRPWIDGAPRRTPGELMEILGEAAGDLSAHAWDGPMDQWLERERLGTVHRYTRAVVIAHVTTHGMHHRAQMLNMLRHAGVSPLPHSSVVEWGRAGCPG
ncbi:MAG: hypothetical protein HRU70_01950 [Phycisphaeraceae bacterium]|nr:MAG: hypothetical protein HRU70_01950 [Phycisphaeraceae bacterium]